jgi:hypothetical protein
MLRFPSLLQKKRCLIKLSFKNFENIMCTYNVFFFFCILFNQDNGLLKVHDVSKLSPEDTSTAR